jgi:hypothetical protein
MNALTDAQFTAHPSRRSPDLRSPTAAQADGWKK